MSASQLLEKYQPPKNQAPSKVRRFPLYRRPVPKPPPPAPPVIEPPKEEKPAPPPPVWSNWQLIKEPQWEGYWRASAQEDGGWHYHFTKDGKTIWEQKVPKPKEAPEPKAPKPSTVSVKTDGERVLFGEIPATPFTTAHVPPQALSSRSTTAIEGLRHTFFNNTSHSSLPHDPRALTLRGHSSSEAYYASLRAQAASSANTPRQKRPSQRQDRGVDQGNRINSSKNISTHRDHHRDHSIVYSEEARTSKATSAAQENHRDYYSANKERQGRHGTSPRPREAGSHQNTIGEVVSAEKVKQFDAKKIVDSWQWG